jgi:hypothetical protein
MSEIAVHVIFTEDGIPRWFGTDPVKDSVPLDLRELCPLLPADATEKVLASSWKGILITHRKAGGEWVPREVMVTTPENPELMAESSTAEGPQ